MNYSPLHKKTSGPLLDHAPTSREEFAATQEAKQPSGEADYRAIMKEAAKALSRGELHPEMLVRKRLIDTSSPMGEAFDAILHDLYQRLIDASRPPFLLTQKPSTFLLRDEPTHNAAYLSRSHKFFTFNRGLGVGEDRVRNLDEFVSILAHELTHREYRDRHGIKGGSSKHEEAFADLAPLLIVLHEAGFNPRAALNAMVARARNWDEREPEQRLSQIVDEHPSDRSRALLFKAAIAWLELKRGDFGEETIPLTAAKTGIGGEEISLEDVFQRATHRSPVMKALCEHGWKNTTCDRERASCVLKVLKELPFLDPVRAEDIGSALREIRLDRGNPEHSAIGDEIAERIFFFAEQGDSIGAIHLYRILTLNCFQEMTCVPLGRLRPIAECAAKFIQAKNREDILRQGEDLVRLLEQEPLIHQFNRLVVRPQDLNIRSNISQKSLINHIDFPDFFTNGARKEKSLPHQHHYEVARSCSQTGRDVVYMALSALGIDDYRFYPVLSTNIGALALTNQLLSVRLTHGVLLESNLTEEGRLLRQIPVNRDDEQETQGRKAAQVGLLERTLKEIEQQEAESPEHVPLENPQKRDNLIQALSEDLAGSILNTTVRARTSHSPLATSLLSTSPELVARLNAIQLTDSMELQTQLVRELTRLEGTPSEPKIQGFFQELVKQLEEQSRYHNRTSQPFVGSTKSPLFSFQPLLQYAYERMPLLGEGGELLFVSLFKGLYGDRTLTVDPKKNPARERHVEKAILPLLSNLMGEEQEFPRDWNSFHKLKERLRVSNLPIPIQDSLLPPIAACLVGKRLPMALEVFDDLQIWSRDLVDGGFRGLHPIKEQVQQSLTKEFRLPLDNPLQAAKEWGIVYRHRLLSSEKAHEKLQEILKILPQLPEETQRETLRTIFQSGTIRDPKLRGELHTLYAASLERSYGLDDSSEDYHGKLESEISLLREATNGVTRPALFDTIASRLVVQRSLAYAFRDALEPMSQHLIEQSSVSGIVVDGGLETLSKHKESREALIKFLLSDGDIEDVDYLLEAAEFWLTDLSELRSKYDLSFEFVGEKDPVFTARISSGGRLELEQWRERIQNTYRAFWESPLGVRAALTAELFFPEGRLKPDEYQKVFDEVVKLAIPDGKPHAEEVRKWVSCYVKGKDEFKQPFYLAALLTAVDKTNRAHEKLGNTLALIAELMGPAELKGAQASEGHPGIDEEIQPDAERVKMRADIPTRWELFEMIDSQLSEKERGRFSHIGQVEGGGSIYVSVRALDTAGKDGVLSVERPFTRKRAESGFKSLEKMIVNRYGEGAARARLGQEILREGRDLLTDELQTELLPQKVSALQRSYSRLEVQVGDEKHSFHFVSLLDYGKHFRFTEYADGKPILHALQGRGTSKKEQRATAIAGVAAELTLILSGEIFDTDAHGGNGKESRLGEREVVTKRFDPGGALLNRPTESELKELGEFLFTVLTKAKSAKEILPVIHATLSEKYETEETLPPFLRKVQKALTALGGHIRALSANDFMLAVTAALPHAHPTLKTLALSKVISGKANEGVLKVLIPKLMSSEGATEVKVKLRPI